VALPDFLRLRFRGRLLLVLVGLIALTQAATLAAVLGATHRNVEQQLRADLEVGGRVFRQILDARTAQLLDSVEILTADFAFREAVATRDRETIHSVLENHGARGGADFAVLLDLDGSVIASTAAALDADALARSELLARAQAEGQAAAAGTFAGTPCQLIVVPVRAPVPVAWIAMGFAIDDELAQSFKRVTSLDVSFASADGRRTRLFASTLPDSERSAVGLAIPALRETGAPYEISATQQLTLDLRLDDDLGDPLHALLQTSLSAARAPWRAMSARVLSLGALALACALVAAIRFGRRLALPVQSLVEATSRVRGGRYETPVVLRASDEFGLLARKFNDMQREIAEREQRIVFQAHHDPLTGLPNRTSVRERLGPILEHARAARSRLALVALELDDFRALNDSFGHAVGDRVLAAFAARLRERGSAAELVARVGADEFLVLLPLASGDGAETAEVLANGVSGHFATGEDDLGLELTVRAGVAVFPEHGREPELLLRRADIALQDAKRDGVGVRSYQPGRDEGHLRQLALARDLRAAIAARELRVVYQPKVELLTREVVHVEALVRWIHPVHGPVRPDEFIPLAERIGVIGEIGQLVLAEVLRQWRGWNDRGIRVGVAVNLSPLELADPALPARVRALLEAERVPPGALTLEITESVVMEDPASALRALGALRDSGITLSIDDFGTGHSSLAQLKRLPVHELKIDKSFVLGLKPGSEDEAIVRSIVDLGHRLGLKVVAEGVEDDAVWEVLVASRCDLAQGYLLSRPLPADEFESWLAAFESSD